MFAVMAALNACGYDEDLAGSDPLRAAIRSDINAEVQHSRVAAESLRQVCTFYNDHKQPDPAQNLAQYISLALSLGEPPTFSYLVKEADLPPDASYVAGLVNPLAEFYREAELHAIWQQHQGEYNALLGRMHDPVSRMVLATDVYFRLPLSGSIGRRFLVYLEPQAAPGEVNARNYGSDYFIVVAPTANNDKIEAIRHTYLHFILEPLLLKRVNAIKRLEPIMEPLRNAPIADSYKNDVGLMTVESLIRAVEARLLAGGKAPETAKAQMADQAVREGFVLARYFNNALAEFEKEPQGFQDSIGEILSGIDPDRERKRAAETQFVASASTGPDVQHVTHRAAPPSTLELAEERLTANDPAGAQQLAREALKDNKEDPARAMFILARAAVANKDMEGAQTYFQRTLELAREPRVLAWSHIYLGRILDLREERDAAVEHYRAALAAGDPTADTKAAAERGIAAPYEPPHRPDAKPDSKPQTQ